MSNSWENMSKALAYGETLVGTPYRWWLGDQILGKDVGPFWATNGPPPPLDTIRTQGVCCTGVMNLMLRHIGVPVPGVNEKDKLAGGTGAWENHLIGHLEPIDITENYTPGTLLFRPYQNFNDQGHIGVVLEGGRFLHSYTYEAEPIDGFTQPGCVIDESWRSSHAWNKHGYYMYASSWYSWLSPEDDIIS